MCGRSPGRVDGGNRSACLANEPVKDVACVRMAKTPAEAPELFSASITVRWLPGTSNVVIVSAPGLRREP